MTPRASSRKPLEVEARAKSKNAQKTVRARSNETLSVNMSVNGQPVSIEVAPRLTLADALRDQVGQTGTHVGCEHGVCGMCTVLVDGEAARSCLLLACQLEGSEILSVESLGTQNDLHPLQTAFSTHHALQCGFCTPGMLMSAFDLLSHDPQISSDDIAKEMSGVLCRCTGYKGILAAIEEVATAYPQGIPGPKNCSDEAMLPRFSRQRASLGEADPVTLTCGAARDVRLPDSEPTVSVEVAHVIDVEPGALWAVLQDTSRVALCLPGAELTQDLGDDAYRGRVQVALGPIRLSFVGDVHIIERNESNYSLRGVGQGADKGGGSVQAEISLNVEPHGSGSNLRARADLYMSGRIAQFGRSLADDVSRNMFQSFAESLAAMARGEVPDEAHELRPRKILAMMIRSRLCAAISRIRMRG
jgi:carbon-monoxide dehydrogenase small subunit